MALISWLYGSVHLQPATSKQWFMRNGKTNRTRCIRFDSIWLCLEAGVQFKQQTKQRATSKQMRFTLVLRHFVLWFICSVTTAARIYCLASLQRKDIAMKEAAPRPMARCSTEPQDAHRSSPWPILIKKVSNIRCFPLTQDQECNRSITSATGASLSILPSPRWLSHHYVGKRHHALCLLNNNLQYNGTLNPSLHFNNDFMVTPSPGADLLLVFPHWCLWNDLY